MPVTIECVTRSHRPALELFDRARDIGLHEATQARARERAIGGVVSGLIGPGEDVTWRAVHVGVPLTLTSRVTVFDRPRRFVDEQTRGPFRAFRHEHLFADAGPCAGSVMTDRLTFAAPLGLLGRIAEELVLARHLRRLLEERGRLLAD
ncbi:SRPBCC family protein [Rathayibacter tanaceti]|uniref:Cyclase n=2 Tax=Rathayibacter tanaceti TaxID=1671680 RepID=A0A166I5A5_9MICO|nr:SRPBCC family protein [Rathayibacter tanaceti]KZX21646.1 hypothetical protein ACH61_01248 [Rathayibacter tanaceti]QHC56506.1 cyclase [Rathayibacter tanaceti]TCO36715.1 hypothetical protein EV639_106118 [Rathayibacter tanaceti]